MMTTGGMGPLMIGKHMKKAGQKMFTKGDKTKKNPPGGNASYERQKKTKKPKAGGRRTMGDRYGMSI